MAAIRRSKNQLKIIDLLSECSLEDETYYWSIGEIRDSLGISHNSLYRSLVSLTEQGILQRKSVVYDGYGGKPPTTFHEYIRVDRMPEEQAILVRKEEQDKALELKARELGFKSAQDYREEQFFAFLRR